MKKVIILALVILLLSTIVTAKEIPKLEISKVAPLNEGRQGKPAFFEFTIKNNQAFTDIFTIKPDEAFIAPLSNIFKSVIITPEQIEIGTGKEKTIKVEVNLFDDIKPNKNYITQIDINSVKTPSLQETVRITVNLFAADDIFGLKSLLPEEGVLPGIGVPIKVEIKNTLNAEFKDIEIEVEIEGKNFKDKVIETLNFEKQEVKTKDFLFNFGSLVAPGTYNLIIKALEDKAVKGLYEGSFELLPNYNVEEKVEKESNFLKGKIIVTKKNNGNFPVEENFQMERSLITDFFIKTSIERKIINDKNTWVFLIKPNEEFKLIIEKSYRSFFLGLLIAIVLIIVLYYTLRKEITIKKSVIKIKEYQNAIEIKVLVHVKNNLKRDIENLKIVDIVPHLVKPTGEFSTLKPNKIIRGEAGIKLVWELPVLTSKEERIIGYKATTRLNIVGKLALPPAATLYESDGKTIKIKSNRLVLSNFG
ncbi:hypothetical protein HY498_00565 [Candidatus Woesearchaeota archaeon]|nr:hypothetical protein [Candidatus Woesearchaeota archaeon]